MKTKEKILAKSLELFNKKGIKHVTLRQIALALGISQGNLNYHFKAKADIVISLYHQLVAEMDIEMNKVTQDQAVLSFLYESSLISMQKLYDYRFITQDLFAVLNANEEIKNHYLELQKFRKQQFLILFANLVEEGLMRKEEIEKEYERLYERMNILGDHWINTSQLLFNDINTRVNYYHALLFEIIYPYLTEEGKKRYRELK